MVDRARVADHVQVGVETIEGTAVAANKNIRSFSVDTKIGGESAFFRPDGHKFNAFSTLDMEWSTLALSGKGEYTELLYALLPAFGSPTAVAVVGSVGGKTRVFPVGDSTILAPKSLTVEKGSSVRAQRIAGAIWTDFGMTYSRRNGVSFTGAGFGRLFTDGATLTSSPADLAQVPIVGKHIDIFVDTTWAALGTTKLLRAFTVEQAITGLFGPVWPLNSANASYDGHVDLPPTPTAKLTLEADSTGMAYLSQFRANTNIFVRILATGPEYEAGFPYSFQTDMCLGIKTIMPDNEDNGITTVEIDCEVEKDSTSGKGLEYTLVNDIATP